MKSFVEVKQGSDFPLENLPYGVFKTNKIAEPHIGVAIGDYVLDLFVLDKYAFFDDTCLKGTNAFSKPTLNYFMSLGKKVWSEARKAIQVILSEDNTTITQNEYLKKKTLISQKEVQMLLPVDIGDYTDFYSSREHATNVGLMFRGKDNALMPNWLHLPVGYHGRSSSIVISGTPITRPKGQSKSDNDEMPSFGPTKQLDFELEMGFFIGNGNNLDECIDIKKASEHIFGMVLVNDWSARDIQKWEYVPLGPFLGKNFATSISPWIVTMDALEPFKTEGPVQNPEPLPYLRTKGNPSYDINLEVSLQMEEMNEPCTITKSNFKYLYWNINQQLAHHTVNGCNTRTGDLMASGTISGETKDSFGSMLELAWKGTNPVKFPNGSERKFIHDGDKITMKAYCECGDLRIGFGEVTGKILPAT